VPKAHIPVARGFQDPFARRIHEEAKIRTVGLITEAHRADEIVTGSDADLGFLGRELLRELHWALKARRDLGGEPEWATPYGYVVKGAR
jgi:2,4-dienoyl-CoA reductase-like NADH-dependent reductase (Old Yellow Enzyme family)